MTALPNHRVVAPEATRTLVRAAVSTVAEASLEPQAVTGTVLVHGPEGYQTSSLVREAARELTGWKVIGGNPEENGPVSEWALLRALGRSLARHGVEVDFPFDRQPSEATAAEFGELLLDAFIRAADGAPVALVVDALQAVDTPSGEAVIHTLRHHGTQQLLLLAASETAEGRWPEHLRNLADANPAHHLVVRVPPLTADDAREIATELIDTPLPGRVARRFVADADGNPALIAELIRAYRADIERGTVPSFGPLDRGGRIPLLRRQRDALAAATPGARTATEIVSVLRSPTPVTVVNRMAAWLGITQLFGAFDLDEAVRIGLVRVVDEAPVPTVAPSCAVAADHIEATIPLARRRELHAAAADVVTGLASLQHRIGAVEPDDVTLVPDLLRSAQACAATGDAETAIGLALSAVRLAAPGERQYEHALLTAGLLALRLREHRSVIALLDEFGALPDSTLRDVIMSDVEFTMGRRETAVARARRVIDGGGPADTADDRVLRAHVAIKLPLYAIVTGHYEHVFELAAGARAVVAQANVDADATDPDLRWMIRPADNEIWLTAWELAAASHLHDEQRIAARALRLDRLIRNAPDSAAVLDAVMLLARTASYNGDVADAVQRLQRIVPSFGRFRGAWLNHAGLSLYAHLLFQTGEWKAAQAAAQRAVDSALDASFTGALRTAYGASGLVAAARGDAAAVARVERLLGLVPLVDLGTSAYVPDLADIMRAELAAALDDPAAQLAATSAALAARRAGSVWSWLQLHVEALVRAGRVDDARTIAAQALGGATPWMRTPCNVARLEAYLASVRGDARQAVERYTALVRSPFGAPLPFERARDRVAFARALALVGRDDAALEQLALALPVFERLKTPNYIERARALEAELLARRPVPITAPAAPASAATDPLAALTDREREVALAVGRGLTNREVAAQLFVSVTTVNFHVRNILAKLSLSSRRELRPLTAPHDSGVR